MSITKLGHVELRVTDLDRSLVFYTETMGLGVTEEVNGSAYLRASTPHHELTLTQGERPGVEHYAWRVGAPEDLDEYEKLLRSHGFESRRFEGEPGQDVGLRFTDPAGMECELYWDMESAGSKGRTRGGVSPERVSHIVFATSALDEFVALYRRVFGFQVSDWIESPVGTVGCFLRCNPDHHTLAVLRAPVPGGLHHVAWYVPTFDGLKNAADAIVDGGNEIEFGPGRHGIGENTYLYFRDPDRMRLEATGEMLFLPDTDYQACVWKAEEFGKALSSWGQAPPESFTTEVV